MCDIPLLRSFLLPLPMIICMLEYSFTSKGMPFRVKQSKEVGGGEAILYQKLENPEELERSLVNIAITQSWGWVGDQVLTQYILFPQTKDQITPFFCSSYRSWVNSQFNPTSILSMAQYLLLLWGILCCFKGCNRLRASTQLHLLAKEIYNNK